MSELVIRAPLLRRVVRTPEAAVAPEPVATTDPPPTTRPPGRARPWCRLPEEDGDVGSRATLGKVSGWFMPLG